AAQFREEMLIIDLDTEAVFMKRLQDPRRRQQVISMQDDDARIMTAQAARIVIEKNGHGGEVDEGQKIKIPPPSIRTPIPVEEEVYSALVLGTRDYVQKNRFEKVCVGLSGGVDSALVASIAVDAIGSGNVNAVFMPSPYTSKESREDALNLADNLGIEIIETRIDEIFKVYIDSLKAHFKNKPSDSAEENIQARIRGNMLMALSNKFGWLVLTTGNKSEMSVGYATLYGDMAGGFAVIKDVPKTLVYKICRWRNQKEGRAVIPERTLSRAPSAELRPDQKDTDTLPPYNILDPILKAYVEEDRAFDEIIDLGYEQEIVKAVIGMVDSSEYKRRQSPPGIKITQRAFGRDRRFPITNRYRGW
ncbi:MAG: NAD(+) synthase, partial [Nitrospirae bacterium]|nr:NAD(+) synthase [Nitrospirota bacterium]